MKHFFAVLIAVFALTATLFAAEAKAPLFSNITTDNPYEASMATHMSVMMQGSGHPVTIFLNDRGVLLASKSHKELFEAQSNLEKLIKNGATVLVCPVCMKEFKLEGEDLIKGATVANHKKVEDALFAPNTQTLSW